LRGNIEILRLLHAEGADVSIGDLQGVTPLHAAVFEHHIEVIEFLTRVGDVLAKINERDESGISVLWVAVQRGDEDAIAILSQNGASLGDFPPVSTRQWVPPEHRPPSIGGQQEGPEDDSDDNGNHRGAVVSETVVALPKIKTVDTSTLAKAAADGDLDELLRMAALGENMDASDDLGRTPLRLACEANHNKCVKCLVTRGSNKEARDHATGATPLHAAALRGHTPTVSVLIESGADVKSRRGEDGATPLWLACDGGFIDTVAVLLAHPSCDPDVCLILLSCGAQQKLNTSCFLCLSFFFA
jgi:ankyrin repeat protein